MSPALGFLNGVKSICSIMTQNIFFSQSRDNHVYGSVISDIVNVIDVTQDSVMWTCGDDIDHVVTDDDNNS